MNRKRAISILAIIMAVVMILSLILSVLPTAYAVTQSDIDAAGLGVLHVLILAHADRVVFGN